VREVAWNDREPSRPIVAAVLVLGSLVPLAPALLDPGRTLAWRDTARLYAPVRGLVVEALREGRIPLWNPHDATGIPLLAQGLHGVFHPASLVAALLPGVAIDGLLALYVVGAALGAYMLARSLGGSRVAALAGGLGYASSGMVLGATGNLVYLAGAASMPWGIAGLRRAADPDDAWGGVAAALGIALSALCGEVQSLGLSLAGGLTLALHRGGWRGLATAGAHAALGLALAGVQLVPSWHFFRASERAQGVDPALRSQWALLPARLVEIGAPGLFVGRIGPCRAPLYEALAPRSYWALPFSPSVFIGAPVLAFAVLAAIRSRAGRLAVVLALGCLWLALGPALGAESVTRRIPVWGAFRYAEKLVTPATLFLCAAAALGIDAVAARPARRLPLVALGIVPLALAGVAFGRIELPPAVRRGVLLSLLLGAAACLAVAAFSWLAARIEPGARRLSAAALVFLAGLGAAPFALHVGPGIEAAPPALAAPPPGPRLYTPLDPRGEPQADPDCLDAEASLAAGTGVESFNVGARVDNVDLYSGVKPVRLVAALRAAGVRRYGVTHVVIPAPPYMPDEAATVAGATAGAEEIALPPGGRVRAFAVPHRPWAGFAEQAIAAASLDEALARLRTVAADPATVVVEAESPPATADGRVLGVERGVNRIRVEAEADGPALLVVADAFDPGWVAAIDGARADLLAADVLVRAIAFPRGRHVLEMRYEPREVRQGLVVSTLAACALIAVALLRRPPARG